MAVEGIFHDAHEVYARPTDDHEWQWVGTMANKDLAEAFAGGLTEMSLPEGVELQTDVRPV